MNEEEVECLRQVETTSIWSGGDELHGQDAGDVGVWFVGRKQRRKQARLRPRRNGSIE